MDGIIPAGFMGIETIRHSHFFTRDRFGNRGVTVIGAGATGSVMALGLAKLGVSKIDVFDDDVVEPHNLANQFYGPQHVGMPKVEALKEVILRQTGTEINAFNERIRPGHARRMREVVCLLVDTMDGPEGRRGIAEGVILGSRCQFLLETRTGVEHGFVYAVRPDRMTEYRGWIDTMYSDDTVLANPDANPEGCNAQQTIAATVRLLTGFAEWQFLNWINGEEISNEITVSTRPLLVDANQFR